jgi:Na+/H+-dicarboxylate symporter
VATLARSLNPIGGLWIAALQLTVVPLVVSQVVVAVLSTERLGILGARTLGVFAAMLVTAGLLTLLIAPPLVSLYRVDPATVAALRAGITAPAVPDAVGTGVSWSDRLLSIIPTSVSQFLMGRNLLPLLLGAVVLALLARRFAGQRRGLFQRAFQRLADATLQVVGWILRFAPFGVLVLTFGLAQSAGGSALGLMTAFVLLISGIALFFTALLYPVTAVLGRVSLRRFARAVAPAQLVAMSTRSSLASLPALVEGGRDGLGLSVAATGFVLPFAVATVKVSRVISATVMLLFLVHAYELPLGLDRLLLFSGTVLLLSFIVVGLPGRGPEADVLPAYLAAGVPLAGVMILEAVDVIPDIFKTVLNVTSDMSAAAILSPRSRAPSP